MRNDKGQFDLATKKLVLILKYLKKAGTGPDYRTLRNALVVKKEEYNKDQPFKSFESYKKAERGLFFV